MRLLIITILSFLFVTFMGAVDVFANAHHSHHKGHDQIMASPFNKQEEGKSLHCLLNNHNHEGFCPHNGLPSGKDTTQKLSVDCGGKTEGTLPSYSFHKDNIADSFSISDLNHHSFKLISGIFSPTRQYLSSQNPPPEVL